MGIQSVDNLPSVKPRFELGEVACSSAHPYLKSLSRNSVGAVVTDPPFFISVGRPSGPVAGEWVDPWSGAGTLKLAIAETAPVVAQAERVLRPGGALVVMGQGVALTVWDTCAREAGLDWMAEIAVLWNTGKPRQRNFGSLFTVVRWYSKPGARHTFNLEEGKQAIYSNVAVVDKVPNNERLHVSQKPVGLTNFLISLLTNGDDVVIDPYCGSGSTLVSAAMCGRPFAGCDEIADNVAVARRRIDHHELEEAEPVYLWINGRLEEV